MSQLFHYCDNANDDTKGYNNSYMLPSMNSQANNSLSLNVTWPFPKQALVFTCLLYKFFENTVVKGEIAHDEQFLLFPQCFLSICRTFYHFNHI